LSLSALELNLIDSIDFVVEDELLGLLSSEPNDDGVLDGIVNTGLIGDCGECTGVLGDVGTNLAPVGLSEINL